VSGPWRILGATWVMTVRHDGFAGAAEGAQEAIVMWRDGSKRGSANIWRAKGRNLAKKEKIYGAQDESLWRTTPDKDYTSQN
jgi:hypothetical protein